MKYATLLCDYGGYRKNVDVRIVEVGRDWVLTAAKGLHIPISFVHVWEKSDVESDTSRNGRSDFLRGWSVGGTRRPYSPRQKQVIRRRR